MRRFVSLLAVLGLLVGVSQDAGAQTTGTPLEVGVMAPDFEIPGATRHGVLQDPIRLSDYHGKTVVLAFFYRARTRG
jgi:hypothetical protein